MDLAPVVLSIGLMIVSLTFHEFSHALVARLFGDRTAEHQGRLTLNPISHIDPIGTLLLPVVGALSSFPVIGWAKPVPVDVARLRAGSLSRRTAYAIVSAAGPLSNLLLAALGVLALGLLGSSIAVNTRAVDVVSRFIVMNVGLCVFNLLPIAPLDGSKLLPREFDRFQAMIRPYSMLILLGILAVPPVANVLIRAPMMLLLRGLFTVFHLRGA